MRCFGRVTSPPISARKPPGHLDRRGEMGLVGDRAETDDADEARLTGDLYNPLPKPMLPPVSVYHRDPGCACARLSQRPQEFHDSRIGGEIGKGLDIRFLPPAEGQPRGAQRCIRQRYFFLPELLAICAMNMCCNCSNPFNVAGSQASIIAFASMALMLAVMRSCTSFRSASCNGWTSGSPKNFRASSAVQSMSRLIFIATAPSRMANRYHLSRWVARGISCNLRLWLPRSRSAASFLSNMDGLKGWRRAFAVSSRA